MANGLLARSLAATGQAFAVANKLVMQQARDAILSALPAESLKVRTALRQPASPLPL